MALTPSERRHSRCFHRVISGMEKGGPLRLLTLTSGPEAVNPIQRDFRRLTMRLKRRGLMQDYLRVIEMKSTSRDHIHVIYRGKYIPQEYLSQLWNKIHQSPIVDIRSIRPWKTDRQRVASYLAKYMSKELWRRYSWSWGWVYKGFVKVWQKALRLFRHFQFLHPENKSFHRFLGFWRDHLHGKTTPFVFLRYLELMGKTAQRVALAQGRPQVQPALSPVS